MDADDEEQREALQIGCILNRAPVVPETSANDRGFVASNGEPASVTAARLTAWDGALRAIEYDIKKVIGESITEATFAALGEFQSKVVTEWRNAVEENGGRLPPRLQGLVPTALLHTGEAASGDHLVVLQKLRLKIKEERGASNVVLLSVGDVRKAADPKVGVAGLFREMARRLKQLGAADDDPVYPLGGKGYPTADAVCKWYLSKQAQRAAGSSPPRPAGAGAANGGSTTANYFAFSGPDRTRQDRSRAKGKGQASGAGPEEVSPGEAAAGGAGGAAAAAVQLQLPALSAQPLVVIVESAESVESRPLEDLIAKVSRSFLAAFPILLILGLSTSTSVLQERLPSSIAARLRATFFQIPPAVKRLETVEREFLLRRAFSPVLDGETLAAVHARFLERDMSLEGLSRTLRAAAFLHFTSEPLSFLCHPLQCAANLAKAQRGNPVAQVAVVKKTLAETCKKLFPDRDKAALAFTCKGLGIPEKNQSKELVAGLLFQAWLAREKWAAAVECLAAGVAAAGKKSEGGEFREIFREASKPGFMDPPRGPGRALVAATTKGLRMASAWVRMGELAKQMRDILSAAPDMEAAAAKANDLLELFSSREGTDAAGDEEEPVAEADGQDDIAAKLLEAKKGKKGAAASAAARKQMLGALQKKAEAAKPAVAGELEPRRLAVAVQVADLVRELAEAHLSAAPEEHPASKGCCFRDMHGLERMVGGIGRESFACAMRGAPGGCTCCPEGLTLSSSLPPMVAFYRMLQSKSVFVNSGDLIQEWADVHVNERNARADGAGPFGTGGAAAAAAAAAGGAGKGKKRARAARRDPEAGGVEMLAPDEREAVAATFTRGLLDLQLLGYVRRPSAVGGKRGKPARLQRLIFEHGQRSKAGAGSGAGAFHFGDNGEDEGEDDAEEEAALLAEQMGLVDAGDDGGAAE